MADPALPTVFAEQVLDLVDRIPSGKVMSYGDVAEAIGSGGARQVGRVMATYGGGVPWWRVIRADGTPAPQVAEQALSRLGLEGVPMVASGTRVDLGRARWTPCA